MGFQYRFDALTGPVCEMRQGSMLGVTFGREELASVLGIWIEVILAVL